MATKDNTKATDEALRSVEFHYIKSNHFRVIHSDGAYGGVTARGYLHVAFFSERRPIPQKITYAVDADTAEPREIVKEVREGVIREVEASVAMDETAVKELVTWLNTKLEDFKRVREQLAKFEAKAAKE